ncbi:hypothetical protein, partial [Salmonella enterica]|uniref:hypothetical protein n=1 Tax=Salmonella enterica TaxID=28901 RepID=UPI003F4B615F
MDYFTTSVKFLGSRGITRSVFNSYSDIPDGAVYLLPGMLIRGSHEGHKNSTLSGQSVDVCLCRIS